MGRAFKFQRRLAIQQIGIKYVSVFKFYKFFYTVVQKLTFPSLIKRDSYQLMID